MTGIYWLPLSFPDFLNWSDEWYYNKLIYNHTFQGISDHYHSPDMNLIVSSSFKKIHRRNFIKFGNEKKKKTYGIIVALLKLLWYKTIIFFLFWLINGKSICIFQYKFFEQLQKGSFFSPKKKKVPSLLAPLNLIASHLHTKIPFHSYERTLMSH